MVKSSVTGLNDREAAMDRSTLYVVSNGRRIACSFVLEKINPLDDWRHGARNERWRK